MLNHKEPMAAFIAATVVGVGAAAGNAQAQSTISGVTVTAPRVIGRDTIGAPIEQVSMSARVRIKDLDLKTSKGAAELDKRVSDAARNLCQELEKLYPIGTPDAVACARTAVKEAQGQVTAAKASARG